MDRRELLGLAGGALAVPLAGCAVGGSPIAGRTELDGPTFEREDDELHAHFTREGERVATISLLDRGYDRETGLGQLRLHTWHADGFEGDSIRYLFRLPSRPTDPPAEVYLKRPEGSPWPSFTFTRGEESGHTLFEVPDLGFQGSGSVTLDFIVEGDPGEASLPVSVDALLGLSGNGFGQFTAEGTLDWTFGDQTAERHPFPRTE